MSHLKHEVDLAVRTDAAITELQNIIEGLRKDLRDKTKENRQILLERDVDRGTIHALEYINQQMRELISDVDLTAPVHPRDAFGDKLPDLADVIETLRAFMTENPKPAPTRQPNPADEYDQRLKKIAIEAGLSIFNGEGPDSITDGIVARIRFLMAERRHAENARDIIDKKNTELSATIGAQYCRVYNFARDIQAAVDINDDFEMLIDRLRSRFNGMAITHDIAISLAAGQEIALMNEAVQNLAHDVGLAVAPTTDTVPELTAKILAHVRDEIERRQRRIDALASEMDQWWNMITQGLRSVGELEANEFLAPGLAALERLIQYAQETSWPLYSELRSVNDAVLRFAIAANVDHRHEQPLRDIVTELREKYERMAFMLNESDGALTEAMETIAATNEAAIGASYVADLKKQIEALRIENHTLMGRVVAAEKKTGQ